MSESFGRYTAEAMIGHGGMGVVWRGHDPLLARTVAIKLLRVDHELPRASRDQLHARFLREARAAAGLAQHPNIVTVYDVGVTADNSPYLVMELIDGEGLDALLHRQGRLEPEPAARIGAQVANALVAAHAAGIVHRDVKPANILLTRDGNAKLMDFGIAHIADSGLTAQGDFLGSPLFASPEQIRGEPPGPAADIYSLGTTVYLLLTGSHPFKRPKLPQTLHAVVHDELPPVTATRAALDPAWDSLFARAMAKQPADRHADAAELRDAFEARIAGLPDAPSTAPELEVRVEEGPDRGRSASLKGRIEIGREGGDLALTEGTVSTRHCTLELGDGVVRVRDLGSSNGTFVGDVRIEQHTIAVGDRFRVGKHTVLRIAERAAGTASAVSGTLVEPDSVALRKARPLAGAPRFTLTVVQGARRGVTLSLRSETLVLSRDEGPGRLDDTKVSRKHASLELRGGRLFLRDLASTNGTWVDGQRVREVELRSGDRFRVGDTVLAVARTEE